MRLQGRIRHRRQPLHRPLQQAAPQVHRILRQPGQIHPRPADKDVLPLPVIIEKTILSSKKPAWENETMHIESLMVKNIGPFDVLNAEFNPKINVIVGANGIGKTSLLRCITYCLTANNMENIRMRKGAMLKLNCNQNIRKCTYGADDLVNKDQGYRTININNWNVTPHDGYDPVFIHQQDKDYNLLAIGAYRYFSYQKIGGMTRESAVVQRRREYLQNNPRYLESIEMPNIKQWMINRYFQIEKDWASVERKNWNALMSQLNTIAPQNSQFKFVRIERDLEPIFSLNGKECYLEELSSGYKSILSIVFLIVDWIEGVNEENAGLIENAEGTILIDEIDAHLHPSWQATILDSLRTLFPNLQFIVTTHSPNVIMSARDNEVIIFNNENGNVDIKPEKRSYGAWQISSVLSDIMQSPNLDRVSIAQNVLNLNEAYASKNIDVFRSELKILEEMLCPNDPILKVYRLNLLELGMLND